MTKRRLRSLALCCNLWLLASWITTGCVLSPGVDLPGKENPGDGDLGNHGDGDGDASGSGGASSGYGGACFLGGAGGLGGSENTSDDETDSRLAPVQGGAPAHPDCLIK